MSNRQGRRWSRQGGALKPRLLDLFCGAGGAAQGYANAGFEVVGVDINPQPRYPFEFHRADALDFLADHWGNDERPWFEVIHASPPCQLHSHGTVAIDRSKYLDLIVPTRELLRATGLPYVIENVQRAPLIDPAIACGSRLCESFPDIDNSVYLFLRRHRLFESTVPITFPQCFCAQFKSRGYKIGGVYGGGRRDRWEAENVRHGGYCPPFVIQQLLMGIDWMTQKELNQAVPPSYTEHIGRQLLERL